MVEFYLNGDKMRNLILLISAIFVFTGCTTVQYNGGSEIVEHVDFPEIGQETTVSVGEHMVLKGALVKTHALEILHPISGVLYDIPEGLYPQIGYDSKYEFYNPLGVRRALIADPERAIAVKVGEEGKGDVCIITIFSAKGCYPGEFKRTSKISEKANSFQQTLIYSGKIGNKINIGYREFSGNAARPAFNNDVEYDLSESNIIGYKGARIQVIDANNNSIKYILLNNFN